MVSDEQVDSLMTFLSDGTAGPDEKDKWRPFYRQLLMDAPPQIENEPALLALYIHNKLRGE